MTRFTHLLAALALLVIGGANATAATGDAAAQHDSHESATVLGDEVLEAEESCPSRTEVDRLGEDALTAPAVPSTESETAEGDDGPDGNGLPGRTDSWDLTARAATVGRREELARCITGWSGHPESARAPPERRV